VHVELYEATTDRIVEGLHNRTFDLGIVRYPLDAFPGLELELVDEDGFCVALPHDHALVAAGEISLRDLADEPLLLPPREHSPPLRALMLEGFQAQGIMPRIANHMATQTATVLALVEMGAGIALVPQSIVGRVGYRVAFRPLAPGSRFRTGLALLSSPDHHTTLADHFRRAIRQRMG
ncbi:LysR family substrate-binding domain-containing protein, partial [Bordetella bronchiseptica]